MPDASEDEIKRSFRSLAKDLHPDRNPERDTKRKLIEVLEAYQVLSDPQMRLTYDSRLAYTQSREQMLRAKETQYKEWFDRYQNSARKRAEQHAKDPYEDFMQSPVYRTAMVISRVYNYIFLFVGIFMAMGPLILWYLFEAGTPYARPWQVMLFPSAIGVSFTYGIYYFLFKYKHDETT